LKYTVTFCLPIHIGDCVFRRCLELNSSGHIFPLSLVQAFKNICMTWMQWVHWVLNELALWKKIFGNGQITENQTARKYFRNLLRTLWQGCAKVWPQGDIISRSVGHWETSKEILISFNEDV
jgi:hypothetical protein